MTPSVSYCLSSLAEADLVDMYAYIAADDVNAAEKMLDKILRVFELLTEHPKMGHVRRDLTALPVRFWRVHPRYFIIYRDQSPLQIVRVLPSSMDIAREMQRKP